DTPTHTEVNAAARAARSGDVSVTKDIFAHVAGGAHPGAHLAGAGRTRGGAVPPPCPPGAGRPRAGRPRCRATALGSGSLLFPALTTRPVPDGRTGGPGESDDPDPNVAVTATEGCAEEGGGGPCTAPLPSRPGGGGGRLRRAERRLRRRRPPACLLCPARRRAEKPPGSGIGPEKTAVPGAKQVDFAPGAGGGGRAAVCDGGGRRLVSSAGPAGERKSLGKAG